MVQLMAPVLSFTAEEVWSYIPKKGDEESSVHLSAFPDLAHVSFPENLVTKWEMISQLKGEVSKALELPGVKAVVTGQDAPGRIGLYLIDRPIFATDRGAKAADVRVFT